MSRVRLISVIAGIVGVVVLAGAQVGAQVRDFRPVTDQMVANPSPNDWLAWRGTTRSHGYSPLDQINRDNARQLQLAWAWVMEPGTQEAAPIVHDGVMYLGNPGGVVQALDGATGDLLWEYRPAALPGGALPQGTVRGIAIYQDRIFVNVPDGRVVALDARTGAVAWSRQVPDAPSSMGFNTAPLAIRGKVISAMTRCARFVEEKCAIVAHDAMTGREVWRTQTIPKPGEPAFDSWGDVPYLYRAGVEMWIPGSYDPDLNLVYWSTAQAKPWTRAARGTDGDALFSNTTLALDPDTGKIVWYRQHVPGETHDLDEAFESVLVDVGSRKSLFTMGKFGILWELDRRTGAFVRATDLGFQKLLDLDPETGRVTYRPGTIPKLEDVIDQCPSHLGVKNWPSMAYTPETQALYIPFVMSCGRHGYTTVEKKPGGGGIGRGPLGTRAPSTTDCCMEPYVDPTTGGNAGGLVAMDTTGKILWQHRQRAPFVSAALATAGGLVFIADHNRYVYAFDVKTGDVLWRTRTATTGHGFPMTYAAGGRQFVAMPIGTGAPYIEMFAAAMLPDITPPRAGNALMVFALPD